MAKSRDITLHLNIDGKNATATVKNIGALTNRLKKQTFGVGVNLAKWGTIITGVRQGLRLVQSGMRAISNTVQTFAEFEVGMRNVNSIIGESEQVIGGLGDQVLEIQKELGITNKDLTAALYQTVSAGVAAGDSIEFLTIATKSARAGITGAEVAVDGLTTVINAWHLEQKETNKVADIMFETVKRGKTTFDKIAGSISNVASLAASSGISFEEISGALATMTKQGVPTEKAMTRIQRSIIGMNEVLGDGWADTMTYQEGLLEIEKRAGGSQNKLKELMGRVEGVNAVLSMTGENSKMAAEDLDAMNNSFGSMEAAFREQTKSMQFTIDQVTEAINVFVIKGVALIAPMLVDGFKTATEIIDGLTGMFESSTQRVLKELREQQSAMKNIEDVVIPLIDEYEALAEKVELSADEKVKLNVVMQSIAQNIPGAVTAWDEYGNAIEISTAKAKDWIEMQRAMLKVKNKEAIEEYKDELEDLERAIGYATNRMSNFNKAGDLVRSETTVMGEGFGTLTEDVKLTDEEILGLSGHLKLLQDELTGTKGMIDELTGENIVIPESTVVPPGKCPDGSHWDPTQKKCVPNVVGGKTGGDGKEMPEPPFESMLERRQQFEDKLNEIISARIEMGRVLSEEEINNLVETEALKSEYFEVEQERNEIELMQEEMMFQSRNQLLDMLVMEEMSAAALVKKIKDAATQDEFKRLKKEHKLQQDRIKMIEAEVEVRDRATKSAVMSGVRQFDASKSIAANMGNLATRIIKQEIAKAVASYVASIVSVSGPLGLFLAAGAGLAMQAAMESIIPKFAMGGLVSGNRHTQGGELINVEGGEYIVNRDATRGNIELLEALNTGGSLNVKSMGDGFGGIITAINNQTKRLEEVERIVRLDPEHLDDEYENYKNIKEHIGI